MIIILSIVPFSSLTVSAATDSPKGDSSGFDKNNIGYVILCYQDLVWAKVNWGHVAILLVDRNGCGDFFPGANQCKVTYTMGDIRKAIYKNVGIPESFYITV
jgi:hypothetical protein